MSAEYSTPLAICDGLLASIVISVSDRLALPVLPHTWYTTVIQVRSHADFRKHSAFSNFDPCTILSSTAVPRNSSTASVT